MPALAEAAKLGGKAQKSGFDWPSWRELLPKIAEETAELEAEAASGDPARNPAVEAELGDLLFTVVNLGRHLGVDAEMALRNCNLRFRQRFTEMERAAPRPLEELSPPELEALWVQAKKKLASEGASAPDPSPRARIAGPAMIEIRSCAGFDEMEACVELQIETWGYDESDIVPRKTFLLAQKIGGQVLGAFDSELAGAAICRTGENARRFRHVFAGDQGNAKRAAALPPLAHAGCAAESTAIAALARNSNGNNGVRRSPAASGTWNGPSIRWKSRTLFSISTGWAPSRAHTVWISMVYPLLDCRVGSRRTVFWRNGSWIPQE